MDSNRYVPSLSRFTALSSSNDNHELVLHQKGSSLRVQAHFRGRLIEIFAPAYARRQHKLAAEAFVESVERALASGDSALVSRFAHTDKLDRESRSTLIDDLRERLAGQLSGALALTAHDVQEALSELSHQLTGIAYLQLTEQACEGARALIGDLKLKGIEINAAAFGNQAAVMALGELDDVDLTQTHALCDELCSAFAQVKPNLHLQHYIGDVEQTAMLLQQSRRTDEARELIALVDSIRKRQRDVEFFDKTLKTINHWVSNELVERASSYKNDE
jgi:hypothetical protein